MKDVFCTISILMAGWLLGYGQRHAVDSLEHLIRTAPDDTSKVNAYWEAGSAVVFQNASQAMHYYRQGIDLAKRLGYDRGLERCHSGASLAYTCSGKYDSALVHGDTAIHYARIVGGASRLALVYLNRADTYVGLQRFSAALKDCDTAMHHAERGGDIEKMARIYSIMNDVYTAQKQYGLALASLDKSQALFEQVGEVQMVGMSHFNRALLFQQTGEPDKAIPAVKKAIAIADSQDDIQNLSAFTILLGQLYHEKGKWAAADSITRISLDYAIRSGNRIQEAVAHDMFHHLHMSRKNYQEAIEEELKAYAILREENDLMRQKDITASLAEAYLQAGDTDQAFRYLQVSKQLNDSLVKQHFNAEIAQLQTTFQVAQKDKEIQLLSKDKQLQQQKLNQQWLLIVASFVVAGFVLLGIALLVNRYRLRQRMKELELRNRIAADLHDEIGSSLSSINMLSQVAARQSTGGDAQHQDILSRVSANARETMERMSDIVWMIKPGEREDQGLLERMERYAYEVCTTQHIAYSLTGKEHVQALGLSMQQRRNVYLIFKEALNNAVKYSRTSVVDIGFRFAHRKWSLSVVDHGRGFDEAAPDFRGGHGLKNMCRRAEEIGGKLTIESLPGAGTKVTLVLDA